MSPEQLLLLAREFGQVYKVQVTNFAALCAASAASTAKIEGIAVHATGEQAAHALETSLNSFRALGGHNQEFAEFCAQVYLRLAATR